MCLVYINILYHYMPCDNYFSKGVLFVQKTYCASYIYPHTFIATDGVTWLIESVSGVTTKLQAINLLQVNQLLGQTMFLSHVALSLSLSL